MTKEKYNIVGVMSGTSLDGIDLVFVTFYKNNNWRFKIHSYHTFTYPEDWLSVLKELTNTSQKKLKYLDKDYTIFLAEIIQTFIVEKGITNIDFIASHGHTALHQPNKRVTYQIGNLPILSKILNHKIICDFRKQDVSLGGQGAPLVPIGDELLFAKYDFCLNLGGFANVSYKENNKRIAFDICPVNTMLNYYASKLGIDYDDKGSISKTGCISKPLLEKLNDLEFYKTLPPKSLGLEWVKEHIIPLIDDFKIEVKDILRTFVEHIAIQISKIIDNQNSRTLITGGGAYHLFLIDRIKALSSSEIIIPSREIVEYKEALIFAFLGVLRDRNEINCFSSVTGAKCNHSSGKIFLP